MFTNKFLKYHIIIRNSCLTENKIIGISTSDKKLTKEH